MKHENNLIWLDCEMTGLDISKDVILEIAVVVTDGQLNVVAQGPSLVINQSDSTLAAMNEWCKKQHRKSNLYFEVQQSQITDVGKSGKERFWNFLTMTVFLKKSPLCGSTIWVDRMFLRAQMPKIDEFTHYRNVDVSSIKELVKDGIPSICKKSCHPKIYTGLYLIFMNRLMR